MSICNTEQMAIWGLVQIRLQYEAVLVNFVGVIRHESNPSRESILRNHVTLDVERRTFVRSRIVYSCLLLSLMSRKLLSGTCLRLLIMLVGILDFDFREDLNLDLLLSLLWLVLNRWDACVRSGRHSWVRERGVAWVGLPLATMRENGLVVHSWTMTKFGGNPD